MFSSAEREKLYALPHELRRTRLQEIMGIISDQEAGATTDEDILKGEVELGTINHSPSPPPLPPRIKSTSSIKAEDLKKAEEMLKMTEQQERMEEEDSVIDIASKLSESPKAKPKVLPRKLTKSSSSSLETAPMIDRSLKPNIPKPLKSPRRRRHHMSNTLRHMYSQDRSSVSGAPTSKNAPGFFTFQGKSTSQYPLGSFMEDSDSNSSDFEEFVPPRIGRKKFISDSQAPMFPPTGSLPFHTPLDRRGSSPFPSSRPQSKEYHPIKKSSPILTRRPTWFSRKMTSPALLESIESPIDQEAAPTSEKIQRRGQDQQSKASRKKKGRSRSLDTQTSMSVSTSGNAYSLLDLHSVIIDSDENTGGTVDSSGYARPFEHINSWRKLIGMDDGSAFSGSLPHLADNVGSAINNDDDDSDTCTYLDPREIAQKLDKNMPQKVRKRLDTVLSNTYLQLISVQPPQFAELPPIQPPNVIAATPVEPSNAKQLSANNGGVSIKEKWENRSLDFIERPDSCLSGYTSDALSDASSTWAADVDRSDPDTEDGGLDERIVNPYDEIKTGSNNSYSTTAEALRSRLV